MKRYTVKKVTEDVPLNSNLSRGGWETAVFEPLADCVTGNVPLLDTRVKAFYSETHLYVGFQVTDEQIVAHYEERDKPLYEEDVVELFLAPGSRLNYYYEFNISPKATVFDAIILNNDGRAGVGRGELKTWLDWNCDGLTVLASDEQNGNWTISAAIPFAELHFAGNKTPSSGDRWRANFCRIEYGADETEYSAWNPPEILDFHTTEKFGELIFE
jgi:hypothetical protein